MLLNFLKIQPSFSPLSPPATIQEKSNLEPLEENMSPLQITLILGFQYRDVLENGEKANASEQEVRNPICSLILLRRLLGIYHQYVSLSDT